MSGTLVFSTDSRSVVADTADRRDARVTGEGDPGDGAAGAARSRSGSAFDLPSLEDRKGPNGGGLVN